MIALVGYTGFVGGNIYRAAGDEIGAVYNTKNIEEAFGTAPDLLIYAGLRAEKYLANHAPEKDLQLIEEAMENIQKIRPKKLVLISTIDVFKDPRGVDEHAAIETEGLHPYGYDRYLLEEKVRAAYPDALIVRLPGLFGKGIKKNFIYDFIHVIPFMLKKEKFEALSERDGELRNYYVLQENGFYQVRALNEEEQALLKKKFQALGFTALHFTDSRSRYQFYDLSRLWDDLKTALSAGLTMLHLATEPVSAAEVYRHLTRKAFVNELPGTPADYDYRTAHAALFGGRGGYILDKKQVLKDIKAFVRQEQ